MTRTQSWTVAAGALGDLTLTLGPQFTQQIALTVTVINTEANPSNPNDVASATATASIDIAVSGGTFEVGSGSTLVGADLGSGGTEIVRSGGLATDTTVSGGGFQDVFGTTSGTVVGDGGRQTVEAGGIASSTLINSGGRRSSARVVSTSERRSVAAGFRISSAAPAGVDFGRWQPDGREWRPRARTLLDDAASRQCLAPPSHDRQRDRHSIGRSGRRRQRHDHQHGGSEVVLSGV